jgi:hypothetical protein
MNRRPCLICFSVIKMALTETDIKHQTEVHMSIRVIYSSQKSEYFHNIYTTVHNHA